MPVGVSYRSELSRNRERAAADLEAIQTLGFNSLHVPLEWAAGEPARGQYQFETLDRIARRSPVERGCKVVLRLDTASPPDWLLRRYPDGRFVPESKPDGARPDRACLDHPGVRADVEAYVAAVAATRRRPLGVARRSTLAAICRTASACVRIPSGAFASG